MHRLLVVLLLSLVVSCSPGTKLVTGKRITAATTADHVKILSSDQMEGRGLGTRGIDLAAEYIAQRFEEAGLKPGGPDGTWYQPFDMTVGMELGTENELRTKTPDMEVVWKVEHTFSPLGFSDAGQLERTPVVFAGYGITAPQFDYDDYKGIDVKDKAVLVMRYEPSEDDPHSPFRGREQSRYAAMRYKAINAREHGARAILYVTPIIGREKDADDLLGVKEGFAANGGILALHVKREIGEKLLSAGALELRSVQKAIDDLGKPRSKALDATVTLNVDVKPNKAPAKNVIGILPGSDPKLKEQTVVVGAHYDGLGFGGEDNSLDPDRAGQVHNGADDNASGTAAVLEIARSFGGSSPHPKRTVVFMAFSAEESGLGGSSHYTKQPVRPLESTVAMLNMDMIGRMREHKVHAFGSETALEFEDILKDVNIEGLIVDAHGDGYGPSDHTPFFAKDIPVLHFFTGAHPQYHKTTDDYDKINTDGLGKVTRLVARSARTIADGEKKPTFNRPKRSSPHGATRQRDGSSSGQRGYGAYFGSIPDFTERDEPGVKLTGVREGSPASKAGVKAGDVVKRFGGVEVKNLYDFTFALRQHKPGDQVEVTIERNGKDMEMQVVLGKRGH